MPELKLESLWTDLESPTDEQLLDHSQLTGDSMPALESIKEIEASSRFFLSGDVVHLRAFFITENEGALAVVPVGLLITDSQLLTVHWAEVPLMQSYRQQLENNLPIEISSWELVIELFAYNIDKLADEIESLYSRVDKLNIAFTKGIDELEVQISGLGYIEGRNEKVRFSLLDQQQTLANLNRHKLLSETHQHRLADLLGDIRSLIDHSEGILHRISLHASIIMSRAQLADSRVTKVFSIVAILFLPPTLIASVYGMNFNFMPELHLPWGYAMAIGMMLLSSLVPFCYFKWKKWL